MTLPGDLNGDGFDDFAIGAGSFASGATPGRVYIYFGGPTANAVADLVLTGESIGDRFGYALAAAGDPNSDGHPDLIVGAYQNDAPGPNAGRAYVFFGGPGLDSNADLVLSGEQQLDEFGIAVASAGDANADGHDDVLVGAHFNRANGLHAGRAYVFFGGPSRDAMPDLVIHGNAGDRFGFSVSGLGDLNGDGRSEFLVGAYYASGPLGAESGRVDVCFPAADGSVTRLALVGDQAGARLGDGLGAGDVNGDGHPDILVGASRRDGTTGRAWVYFGGPAFDPVPDLTLVSGSFGDAFGRSFAGGADVDSDGFGDLVVGSPAAGGTPGRMLVYFGGPAIDTVPDRILSGIRAGEAYGWSVAAPAGHDANGDGVDDVLVGALGGRAELGVGPCVAITCPPDTTGAAGATVTRRFRVTNCDVLPLDLIYDITDTRGWCAPATGNISIAPGDSASVSAACVPLDDVTCGGTTMITFAVNVAACPSGPLARCTTSVTRSTLQPELHCPPTQVAAAGDTLHLEFCLRNPSAATHTFEYQLGSTWCPGSDGFVTLAAGDSLCLPTTCIVPAGAACSSTNSVSLVAYNTCVDSYYGIVVCGTQIAVGASVCAQLLCPSDTMVVTGTSFTRTLCLANCSSRSATFDYAFADDQGWCTPANGSLVVAAGDTTCVLVTGTAPLGAACASTDELTWTVESRDCPKRTFACTTRAHTAPPAGGVVALAPQGPPHESGFGIAVASPGDLSGDGYADFVAGAVPPDPDDDSFPGRAHVFFGGPAADEVPDLVLSGESNGDQFGYAVAGAGDFNGDGHADLAVGAYRYELVGMEIGRVYIYFGGPGMDAIPDFVAGGLQVGEEFGIAIDGVGDVNADGRDDLLVGARFSSAVNGAESGRAYLYFGGPAPSGFPDLFLNNHAAGERFGSTVARSGDVNGDGHRDFLVGANHNPADGPETGRAYLYFGGPGLDDVADLVLRGNGNGAHFSDGLAAADVNADGSPDLLVGAPQYAGGTGRAYVYFGGAALDNVADLTLDPGIAGDGFGRFVSGGADLDANGWADFVVGAPGTSNGGAGRAWVYHGGPSDLDDICDGVLNGEAPGDRFGWSGVATGADVDANGNADLILGAVDFGTGRVYVYSRLRDVPVQIEDWAATESGGTAFLSWRLSPDAVHETERVLLQRSDAAAGPYEVRATLAPRATMESEDHDLAANRNYWYRLVLETRQGDVLAGPFPVSAGAAFRTALDPPVVQDDGTVRFRYAVGPATARVRIDVLDVAGRRVHRYDAGTSGPGRYETRWDRRNESGARAARGVYIARLETNGTTVVRKFVVARP